MYNRNKRGPNTEPWGTPEFINPQSECIPLSTTLCFLFTNNLRRFPCTLFCFSLNISPSCHTVKSFRHIKINSKQTSTIPEDEEQPFVEILSRYDKATLDLEYLMQWQVATLPWAKCNENENSRSNSKSLFRNNFKKMSPIA